MRRASALAAVAALPLLFGSVGVVAMGSGSDSSSDNSTASASSTSDDYIEAQRRIEAQDYSSAIPLLEQILAAEPDNADALNYLGYSHRKLGDSNKALAYYLQALASEPEHLGANEYLGELYLEMGDLPRAQERLAVLQRVCDGCVEEEELKEKIAIFEGS